MLAERPQGVLVIVGSGPEENNLRRLAVSLGLAQRVIFAGQQPNDRLKTYFSAADVTVLASSREGWANVLLESMACGTPVVATRVNGTPEVVASPVAGRLAERRDVKSSASCTGITAGQVSRAKFSQAVRGKFFMGSHKRRPDCDFSRADWQDKHEFTEVRVNWKLCYLVLIFFSC